MATIPASKPLSSPEQVGPHEDAAARARRRRRARRRAARGRPRPRGCGRRRRRVLSQLIPTCSRMAGSSQLTNFGETTPALERKDSSTSWWMASGSSATSSWHSRKKAAPSTMPSASLDAAAYPGRSGRWRTKASGRMRPTRSVDAGVVVPGREHQDGELLVVLRGQGGERLFEPGPGSVVTTTATTAGTWASIRGQRLSAGASAPSGTNGRLQARNSRPSCLLLFNKRDTVVCERRGRQAARCVPDLTVNRPDRRPHA